MRDGWTPDAIGELTIIQLICIGNEEPPETPSLPVPELTTPEAVARYRELLTRKRSSWDFDAMAEVERFNRGEDPTT